MVELKEKVIHSTTYDINIRQYLTYAQIQQIVNAVEMASKEDDSWSARQTNIDGNALSIGVLIEILDAINSLLSATSNGHLITGNSTDSPIIVGGLLVPTNHSAVKTNRGLGSGDSVISADL